MKKKTLRRAVLIFLSIVIVFCICALVYIHVKKSKTEDELLDIADNIVNESVVSGSENNCIEEIEFSIDSIEENSNIFGKIIIPKLNIEAPVKDGTTADVLKEAVGHFSNTRYWDGNVCLASHNRGTYAHYFEKINELKENDTIMYQTKLGTRIYYVESTTEIPETDLSVLENKENNCITLITCITGKKDKRLCVRAIEKNN